MPDPSPEPQGDLEYDLAHEAIREAMAAGTSEHRPPADIAPPFVPAAADGDYSYDMAHDVASGWPDA